MFKRFRKNETAPIETVKPVQPELLQMCAACGTIGATVPLKVSYFGYIALPFVVICDVCEENRKAGMQRHYVPLKKTLLEHPAAPRTHKKALVPMNGGVVNIGLAGKDSGVELVIPMEA